MRHFFMLSMLIFIVSTFFGCMGRQWIEHNNDTDEQNGPLDPNDYLADDPMANDIYPGPLDEFAQCVTDSGAFLYGSYLDFRVETQRLMFNRSVNLIKYVDCLSLDGEILEGQILTVCAQEDIVNSPTWIFGDGSRESGIISLEDLADITGCELPEDTGSEYELMAKRNLAKKLTDSGAVLYGVVQCSYCDMFLELFGEAEDYVDYFLCDSEQAPWEIFKECRDLEIEAYPTWIFGDGSSLEGLVNLNYLAILINDNDWPDWAD